MKSSHPEAEVLYLWDFKIYHKECLKSSHTYNGEGKGGEALYFHS